MSTGIRQRKMMLGFSLPSSFQVTSCSKSHRAGEDTYTLLRYRRRWNRASDMYFVIITTAKWLSPQKAMKSKMELPPTPTEVGTHLQPSGGFEYRQQQWTETHHWRWFIWEVTDEPVMNLMKPCLCAVAFICWGSPPQIAKFECPCRAVPYGDIAGAQPTLRSVDSVYIFKPTTTVRLHKRQKFAVRIGKLSRNSHLHIAAALWDVGAVGSKKTGNREAGNAVMANS